jgi:NAD(P)-dependent dehydrogenase (short-subunit alcohol dehydrogenase family)
MGVLEARQKQIFCLLQGGLRMARRFKDQVAFVVGGAQGIGKAIAVRLGVEGADVVIADVDKAAMEITIQEMRAQGSRVQGLTCDVRHSAEVSATVQQVLDWHGRIDVLMHIAGIAPAKPFLELDEATLDDTLNVNLRGAFLVARAVVPHMVERRKGKLVFMASTNSWDGEAQLAHYNASKSGVFLLAKTLARELGKYGINSNAVGPGPIRTRLSEGIFLDPIYQMKYHPETGVVPLGRLGTPEDVAGPALFLASEDAAYVSGVLLFVDGGQLA